MLGDRIEWPHYDNKLIESLTIVDKNGLGVDLDRSVGHFKFVVPYAPFWPTMKCFDLLSDPATDTHKTILSRTSEIN